MLVTAQRGGTPKPSTTKVFERRADLFAYGAVGTLLVILRFFRRA